MFSPLPLLCMLALGVTPPAEPLAPPPSAPDAAASADAPTETPAEVVPPIAAQPPAPAPIACVPSAWNLSLKLPSESAAWEELILLLTAPQSESHRAALTREEALALLADPRAQRIYGERTLSLAAPSSVKRQGQQHRELLPTFLLPKYVAEGVTFSKAHEPALARAQERHGVDRDVIVSILMWESRLGTLVGDFYAFNIFTSQRYFLDDASACALEKPSEQQALAAVDQPARLKKIKARAEKNLVALVTSAKARGLDPLAAKGSWAGALGYSQFMPQSLRWAEDGDGDGVVDLYTFPDAIASIARYLKEHGFAEDRRHAVWEYNHEESYVNGVLAWADALKKARTATPAAPAKKRIKKSAPPRGEPQAP